jgi:tetratricopeptide (TPR) repeat protein
VIANYFGKWDRTLSSQTTAASEMLRPSGLTDRDPTLVLGARVQTETLLVALLIVVTLLCYANVLANSFVYDDDQQILQNPYIKSWRYLPEIFTTTVWSFVGQAGTTNYYRPLMTLSFLVLWTIFGPIPFGFHLFSIVFHAGVVLLVFYAGRKVFQDWRVGWVGALLFALHPIHTEAVDWIAALPDLESAFLFLAAFGIFVVSETPGWKQRIAQGGLFILALLAKEPALMLVAVAVVFEHGVRVDREISSFRQKLLRYAPICLVGAAYLLLRIALFGKLAPVLQHPRIGWAQSVYSAFALLFGYAHYLLWPAPLSAFHVFHASGSLFEPAVLAGLALTFTYVLGVAFIRKTSPAAAFALLWVGITIAPVLNPRWMAANVFTERYLYLPSVGFCWFVAWCSLRLWDFSAARGVSGRAARWALAAVLVAIAVTAATRVILRNRDWQSDFTLYTRTLETDPDADIIRSNLAGVYFERSDYVHAGQEWERSLAGKPDNVITMNALGILYTVENRYPEAEAMLKRAMAAKPLWADPHYNYGILLHDMGRDAASLDEYRKAVELAPLNPEARRWYAGELVAVGNTAEAELQFKKSLELQPSYGALHGLATLYVETGQPQAAETVLRRIVAQYPYDGDSHLQLGNLLATAGKRDEARREYQAVLQTDPTNADAVAALKRLQAP